jgi:hypothetical protein
LGENADKFVAGGDDADRRFPINDYLRYSNRRQYADMRVVELRARFDNQRARGHFTTCVADVFAWPQGSIGRYRIPLPDRMLHHQNGVGT